MEKLEKLTKEYQQLWEKILEHYIVAALEDDVKLLDDMNIIYKGDIPQ